MAGYAQLLDALLGELGIDAAAVVGNSMGGFIAAELAISYPQRVERLVLVSAAGISTRGNAAHRAGAAARAARRAGAGRERRLDGVALGRRHAAPAAARGDADVVAAHPGRLPAPLAAEQLRGAGKPGFMRRARGDPRLRRARAAREIACPTLIVWGERDRLISVRDADVFAELIPNSRKVVFADTGHVAMLERPAAFNALLDGFLRRVALSARRRPRRRCRRAWRTSGSRHRCVRRRAARAHRRARARRSARLRARRRGGGRRRRS